MWICFSKKKVTHTCTFILEITYIGVSLQVQPDYKLCKPSKSVIEYALRKMCIALKGQVQYDVIYLTKLIIQKLCTLYVIVHIIIAF